MSFRIAGISPEPFRHLFGLSDTALARANARRYVVDATPGFPDRIEMRDLEPGERALLVNYVHLDGAADAIVRIFCDPQVAFVHAHYAVRGCFAARIDRHTSV